METANSDFIKKLVARGDGISFLVKQAVVEDLHGVHDGAGTNALVNRTPSLATRSNAGVFR